MFRSRVRPGRSATLSSPAGIALPGASNFRCKLSHDGGTYSRSLAGKGELMGATTSAELTPRRAFNRFGLGARPGDRDAVGSDPRGAVLSEISEAAGRPVEVSALASSADIYAAIQRAAADGRAMKKRVSQKGGMDPAAPISVPGAEKAKSAQMKEPSVPMRAYRDEIAERIQRARHSRVGFVERLTMFWSNHFAVAVSRHRSLYGMAGAFEREAIRPFVLGRFGDMLREATRHPAMLLYLDNVRSTGADSPDGKRLRRGINENHARELLELHTVGVRGGYTQADVTAVARAMTGWTIGRKVGEVGLGQFVFESSMHQPGSQSVMGKIYARTGEDQAAEILHDLAKHPSTAQHLGYKLAIAFVADPPPPSLVDRLSRTFRETDGDLVQVSRALVESDEAWVPGERIRSPQEFVLATYRALPTEVDAGETTRSLATLGHVFWDPPSPEGYAIDGDAWAAPDSITNRLDFAERVSDASADEIDAVALADDLFGHELSDETRTAIRRAGSRAQAATLLLMSPEFQRR